ncbi:hypothetical protein LAZ67_13001192 [Cordylochernes scorpioides]|uniref:Uncharacterized protein n=1 Tax=Cordylochernes scorpioides TaxID=51811 RepID=A0ABY6L3M7_9ARAC|nr:hypothetical protein LAZ67_13001192 [Cordylochernes scorpioides]
MASAKTRIYKYFLVLELRGVQEDPLLVYYNELWLFRDLRTNRVRSSDLQCLNKEDCVASRVSERNDSSEISY